MIKSEVKMELTILMPCLNEEETLEIGIKKANMFLKENCVEGEILIADNGSTDRSIEIAEKNGARVINVSNKGYGNALIAGCENAKGKYVIMGDADDSYDFLHLMPFLEKLREGYELVMGNRFAGGIEKGAMPWLHRYIGNPILSFIGRLFYGSKIKDFHCGLRGYNTEAMRKLKLNTGGMEYASEMVVKSELNGLKIAEVPTTLKRDGRSRPPHLRSFHDGWRHLKFLLIYAPDWLFLYPGIIMFLIGMIGTGTILIEDVVQLWGIRFSINTLLYSCIFIIIGAKIAYLYVFTRVYASNHDFIVKSRIANRIEKFSVDGGVFVGVLLMLIGIALSIMAVVFWKSTGFGTLLPEEVMKITIPAVTLIVLGVELIFSSFFIGVLNIRTNR